MDKKIVRNIPELMVEVGFSGAVDYLVRVGCNDKILSTVLRVEADVNWAKLWITKPSIRDPKLSKADEKKLWENFKLMQKGGFND